MAEDGKNGIEQVGWTPEVEELLCDWRRRVYAAQAAYYGEAERLRRRNYQLGIPVVIVSSLVGTAIFGNWADDQTYKWWVGGVSILAAVLASLSDDKQFVFKEGIGPVRVDVYFDFLGYLKARGDPVAKAAAQGLKVGRTEVGVIKGKLRYLAPEIALGASTRAEVLGFVFQTFNLIPVLTAYENVARAKQATSTRKSPTQSGPSSPK